MAKLYFYFSAMNAGKSTTLLQASYNYIERGMQTLLFCPKFDTRFGKPAITSRIGLSSDAHCFDSTFSFFPFVKHALETYENLRCVLVDEAHFLTKHQIIELVEITKKLRTPVLCYGLRTDFLGEPFEGSSYLLSWAEEIIEIKTMCECGKKATMNVRIDEKKNPIKQGSKIQIGGNESYISTCMECFLYKVSLAKEGGILCK